MNSLTEQERLGLDDVFMSISTENYKDRPFEQIKLFFAKIDFHQHIKKPKKAILSIKKGYKKGKSKYLSIKKAK